MNQNIEIRPLSRVRWDYERATWRGIEALDRLFLRRCTDCGHEYCGGMNKRRCQDCARVLYTAGARAHVQVKKAIRRGDLKPPTEFHCVDCGLLADRYDHRDYDRPLEVEPVCHSCNAKRGPARAAALPLIASQ